MPLKIEGRHVAQKAIQESPFRPNLSYREFFQSTASTSRRWRRVIIIQGWQLVAKKSIFLSFPPLLSSPSRHIFNVEFYEIIQVLRARLSLHALL